MLSRKLGLEAYSATAKEATLEEFLVERNDSERTPGAKAQR